MRAVVEYADAVATHALKGLRPVVVHRLKRYAIRAGYHSRPSFLIIGAQKAGTTALFYYLAEHPNIVAPADKEVNFFAPEILIGWPEHPNYDVLCSGEETVFDDPRSYRRAEAWYHSHFPAPRQLGRQRVTFEATPEYLYYPKVPERIFRYDPAMKFIALLRNPVERAFSAWNMYRNFGSYRPLVYSPKRETREFEVAVSDEINDVESGKSINGSDYVRRGLYYQQLMRYYECFDRDQILVLDSRELKNNASEAVDRVLEFLRLPKAGQTREWRPMHIGEYEGEIPSAPARVLQDFYRPHNQKLYELLDHDFGW